MATPTSTHAPSDALLAENNQAARRSSLGFLRRSKSTEPLGDRKASGSRKRMNKTQAMEDELRRQRDAHAPQSAPRLPDLAPPPQLETFGGEERDTIAASPPMPRPQSGAAVSSASTRPPSSAMDPYARTESMTHRGRYSYASSAMSNVNSPRRIRRRKDPTPYNVLVVGARNAGKTSFINFLRSALTMPPHKHPTRSPEELEELESQTSAYDGFTSQYLETEIDGERVGLTLWDSIGLERNIADLQMGAVTGFLESKFEETLAEEMKVVRSPNARDTHIHCTFLLLDPVRLDENIAASERVANGTAKAGDTPVVGVLDQNLDLQVLRTMMGKTTIVPVISKADTITTAHMAFLRKAVWSSLKKANIDPLEILTLEDQEEYTSSESADEEESVHEEVSLTANGTADHPTGGSGEETSGNQGESTADEQLQPRVPQSPSQRSQSSFGASSSFNPHVPFSILSPDPHSLASGEQPVGRRFPWGFADPYDPTHCDFVRLKDSVFSDWRAEMREASRVVWYERWRTNRLNRNGQPTSPLPAKKSYAGRMGPGVDGRRTR